MLQISSSLSAILASIVELQYVVRGKANTELFGNNEEIGKRFYMHKIGFSGVYAVFLLLAFGLSHCHIAHAAIKLPIEGEMFDTVIKCVFGLSI